MALAMPIPYQDKSGAQMASRSFAMSLEARGVRSVVFAIGMYRSIHLKSTRAMLDLNPLVSVN